MAGTLLVVRGVDEVCRLQQNGVAVLQDALPQDLTAGTVGHRKPLVLGLEQALVRRLRGEP